MTCDDLAKKCKAGDKKACELYKEKCGKVILFQKFSYIIHCIEIIQTKDLYDVITILISG